MRKSGYHATWNAVVALLLERDGNACGVCGKILEHEHRLSVDHVLPKSRGGPDLLSNFRLVHLGCNISHFRKNYKSERKPQTEAHRMALSETNKKMWAEIRAGIRPHPRMCFGEKSSEIKREWWSKKTAKERAAIRSKAWETRRANR